MQEFFYLKNLSQTFRVAILNGKSADKSIFTCLKNCSVI